MTSTTQKHWARALVDRVDAMAAAERRRGLTLLVLFACRGLSLGGIDDLEASVLALTGETDRTALRAAFHDARRRHGFAHLVHVLLGLVGE